MPASPDLCQEELQTVPLTRPVGRVTGPRRQEVTARLFAQIADTTSAVERKRLRDQVVLVNMGVARAIALGYRGRGIATEDLVQVAAIGLIKAAKRFDLSFDRDFLSYAVPTIRGEVKRHFRDFGWAVRPTRSIQELQPLVRNAASELEQRLQRSPTVAEVAAEIGVDMDMVTESLAADGCFRPSSLDVRVGDAGSTSLGDRLCVDDRGFARAEARMVLGPAVRKLTGRERRILELRFIHGWTQQQIGEDIGITQMQVSRLLTAILAKLRADLTAPTTGARPAPGGDGRQSARA